MSGILSATGLSVTIGRHQVCQNLDLVVNPGETWVILGCNGAGKSTLLSTLAGLRPPLTGNILLNGKPFASHGAKAAARLRGWLGQNRGDPFPSTVLETTLTGRHPHLGHWEWESRNDEQIARHALTEVGLAGLEERDVQTLSGGERQRLAIATLLTQETPLMLLDEPLTHLDLSHQIGILELLRERARKGTAVVAALHDPGLAWRYADRILLVHGDGRVKQGTVQELLTTEHLSHLYGYPLHKLELEDRVAFIPA